MIFSAFWAGRAGALTPDTLRALAAAATGAFVPKISALRCTPGRRRP